MRIVRADRLLALFFVRLINNPHTAMSVATAWVKPPNGITGQDHLGVRAPCEGIYKQLLPGITNFTERQSLLQ